MQDQKAFKIKLEIQIISEAWINPGLFISDLPTISLKYFRLYPEKLFRPQTIKGKLMKANLLILTLLTLATSASAKVMMTNDDGGAKVLAYAYDKPDFKAIAAASATGSEKDVKIAALNKLLDQQQRAYEDKVSYLEEELKKSKERLIEKSINTDKMTAILEKRFSEESTFLKKELVAKTKTLMEYQRQLEKIKPSEDMKNLIKINTELAMENRRSGDQLALIQLKGSENLAKEPDSKAVTGGRMPASVGK